MKVELGKTYYMHSGKKVRITEENRAFKARFKGQYVFDDKLYNEADGTFYFDEKGKHYFKDRTTKHEEVYQKFEGSRFDQFALESEATPAIEGN